MKCSFKTEREIINGQRTDKVNVFIELLSCDHIDETMLNSAMGFFAAYCEKYKNHMYPERVELFSEIFKKASLEDAHKFYESPEEMSESISKEKVETNA